MLFGEHESTIKHALFRSPYVVQDTLYAQYLVMSIGKYTIYCALRKIINCPLMWHFSDKKTGAYGRRCISSAPLDLSNPCD